VYESFEEKEYQKEEETSGKSWIIAKAHTQIIIRNSQV
jgi:hypothetical protein